MSIFLGTLAISGNVNTTFGPVPNDGVKAIRIGNESGLTVVVEMESGGVKKSLYPSTIDWFTVLTGFTGTIKIQPISVLNNVSTFPASSLVFDAIGLNDTDSPSMYPISLVRNTNIGNQVTTVGGVANSVSNDNAASGTSVVESTPQGDASSTIQVLNQGRVIVGSVNNPGFLHVQGTQDNRHDLIYDSSGNGSLTVQSRILANLLQTITGNDFTLDVETAHKIALQVNNADVARITSAGIVLVSGTISLIAGSLSRISIFTGSANNAGTLQAHGLGATPDFAVFQETGTTGDTNTFSWDKAASDSTNVKAWTNNATLRPYIALALKL